jgi:hypothetical protein
MFMIIIMIKMMMKMLTTEATAMTIVKGSFNVYIHLGVGLGRVVREVC